MAPEKCCGLGNSLHQSTVPYTSADNVHTIRFIHIKSSVHSEQNTVDMSVYSDPSSATPEGASRIRVPRSEQFKKMSVNICRYMLLTMCGCEAKASALAT